MRKGRGGGFWSCCLELLCHLESGEFSFNVIPLLYLHRLPAEVKIIPSSALWDPTDTQSSHVVAPGTTGQPLYCLGHGKKTRLFAVWGQNK